MKKNRELQFTIRPEDMYDVELARGGSHIASTQSPATLQAAVVEILEDFVTRYGTAASAEFLTLLAKRLEKRELPDAAALVRQVAEVGIERAFIESTNSNQRLKTKMSRGKT